MRIASLKPQLFSAELLPVLFKFVIMYQKAAWSYFQDAFCNTVVVVYF